VTAQGIIGSDQRVRITPTTVLPWKAHVFIDALDGFGEYYTCTGTMVGPDVVLTAAHCLWDTETSTWAEIVRATPGKDGAYEPYGDDTATDIWVPDPYYYYGTRQYDWGVIKLGSTYLSDQTGWMRVAVLDDTTLLEADFEPGIVGYPGDKPFGTLWGSYRPAFFGVTAFDLANDIDTYFGESGAPVWSTNPDKFYFGYIVGILSRGNSLVNVATRIGPLQMADILEGCRQMHCTVDYRVQVSLPGPSATASPTATGAPTATPTPSPSRGPVAGPFRAVAPLLTRGE